MTQNTKHSTSLDYSILGLVIQTPMTGYGIRMMYEKTALGSYSSSPGTIYPALKRLERNGLLTKKANKAGEQELYSITKKGIAALSAWITQPLTRIDVIKNLEIILLRFAFQDVIPEKSNKKKFLKDFLDAVQLYIEELEQYHETESGNLPESGRLAFEHGLASYKTTRDWIQKIIKTKK